MNFRLQCREYLFFYEDIERGERRGSAERVAAVGMAVEEGFGVFVAAEKGAVDFIVRERGGKRQVAAGQPFRKAQKIGRYALVLAGKHFSGPSHSDRNFVGDQQRAIFIRQLAS